VGGAPDFSPTQETIVGPVEASMLHQAAALATLFTAFLFSSTAIAQKPPDFVTAPGTALRLIDANDKIAGYPLQIAPNGIGLAFQLSDGDAVVISYTKSTRSRNGKPVARWRGATEGTMYFENSDCTGKAWVAAPPVDLVLPRLTYVTQDNRLWVSEPDPVQVSATYRSTAADVYDGEFGCTRGTISNRADQVIQVSLVGDLDDLFTYPLRISVPRVRAVSR
jgi:hypothetical protein